MNGWLLERPRLFCCHCKTEQEYKEVSLGQDTDWVMERHEIGCRRYGLSGRVFGIVGSLRRPQDDYRLAVDELGGDGAPDIAKERTRQVVTEHWSREKDAELWRGELVDAAICYLEAWAPQGGQTERRVPQERWKLGYDRWKPRSRRANLVRAGALIAAEIDRLDAIEVKRKEREGR